MKNNESVLVIHMGDDFGQLSPLLQRSHLGNNRLSGTASVYRGNLLAQLVCTILKFPKENRQVKLNVICSHTQEEMSWERNFDGLIMKSNFKRKGNYLVEHLGPLAMSFKAEVKEGALHYRFIKTKFLGLSIPRFLSPSIIAYEKEVNERYHFSVKVRLPLIGDVISYTGELSLTELATQA